MSQAIGTVMLVAWFSLWPREKIVKTTQRKLWCWEAIQGNYGPDWLFIAQVEPESEAELAHIAADVRMADYTFYTRPAEYCAAHQQLCSYQTFIDKASAAYLYNGSGREPRNSWIYNSIRIHRDTLEVECGYGGRGDLYNFHETAFLLMVFSLPHITWRTWRVLVGGGGYDYTLLREGRNQDDLRAYTTGLS